MIFSIRLNIVSGEFIFVQLKNLMLMAGGITLSLIQLGLKTDSDFHYQFL
jgi:hypothetical protein